MTGIQKLINKGGFMKKLNFRNELLLKNITASFIIKGLSVVIGLLILPVYVKYFKSGDILGVWLTLLSISTWIFTFDLGIGNGLRNYLAKAIVEKRDDEARIYISSAYVSITVLCGCVIIIIFFTFGYIPWNKILNISKNSISKNVLKITIQILLIGTMVQFVLKLINSMMLAIQKTFVPNTLILVSNMALLIYMLAASPKDVATDLITISMFYVVAINFPLLIATIYLFSTDLKYCIPSLKYFNYEYAKKVIKLGSAFLILQVMSMVIFGTNNFLISWFIGPSEVVQYQVYYKLFSLISTLFMIILAPIWSAVTQEYAKKEFQWILKIQEKLYKLLFLGLLGELAVIISSQYIVRIWMGRNFTIAPLHLIITIAIADSLFIIWNINAYVANGMSKVKLQMKLATLGAIINIPLAYFISLFIHDASAIVIANIISLLPYCLIERSSIRKKLQIEFRNQKYNIN